MLMLLYNRGMKKTVHYVPELLKWFEEQCGGPSVPGGIIRKVVHFGNPVRVQYFVNWPGSVPTQASPTSEKPVQKRTYRRASRVRVIHG